MSNMQERPDSDDYPRIFLQDVPLIDVRAPIEFQQGAFARAVNLPLMIDSERRAVGTCYKQHGQQAALALGHRTVNGKLREQRTAAGWRPAQSGQQAIFTASAAGCARSWCSNGCMRPAWIIRVSLAVIRHCAIICSVY